MRKVLLGVFAVVLLVGPAEVFARDYGPLWERYTDNTAFAHWEMAELIEGYPPEEYNPPELWHTPSGAVPTTNELFPTKWEWADDWICPAGIEDGAGSGTCTGWHCIDESGATIELHMPNTSIPNDLKRIFVQITCSKQPTNIWTMATCVGDFTYGTFSTGRPDYYEGTPAPFPESEWCTYNFGLTIEPNPIREYIYITVPHCTVIDQIVVDTECVPEPATMAMLAIGACLLLKRKRRLG